MNIFQNDYKLAKKLPQYRKRRIELERATKENNFRILLAEAQQAEKELSGTSPYCKGKPDFWD